MSIESMEQPESFWQRWKRVITVITLTIIVITLTIAALVGGGALYSQLSSTKGLPLKTATQPAVTKAAPAAPVAAKMTEEEHVSALIRHYGWVRKANCHKDVLECICKPAPAKPAVLPIKEVPVRKVTKPTPPKPAKAKVVKVVVLKTVVPQASPPVPAVFIPPALPSVPVTEQPVTSVPVAMREEPIFERRDVYVEEAESHEVRLGGDAGIFAGRNGLAKWYGGYGSVKLTRELGDGYAVGGRVGGSLYEGRTRGTDGRFSGEKVFVRGVIERNYTRTKLDADGNELTLPRRWAFEAGPAVAWNRFRNANGRNRQRSFCVSTRGEYVEVVNMNGDRAGVDIEALLCGNGTLVSTWIGDSAKNQGMISGSVFYQKQLSDLLAARLSARAGYQFWDKLATAGPGLDLWYDDTLRCGVGLNLPINHPKEYRGIRKSELRTLYAGCGIEVSNAWRKHSKTKRLMRSELIRTGTLFVPADVPSTEAMVTETAQSNAPAMPNAAEVPAHEHAPMNDASAESPVTTDAHAADVGASDALGSMDEAGLNASE
jgi:hypothetical protein